MGDDLRARLEPLARDGWHRHPGKLLPMELQAVVAVAMAVALLFIGHGHHLARRNLPESEAALRALAPAALPDEHNAAAGLGQAAAACVDAERLPGGAAPDAEDEDGQRYRVRHPHLFSMAEWRDERTSAADGLVRRWLEANRRALALADQACDRTEVAWPMAADGSAAASPSWSGVSRLHRAYRCRCLLALHDRDWPTVMASVRRMTRLADLTAASPCSPAFLFATSLEGIAATTVLQVRELARGDMPPGVSADLAALAQERGAGRWRVDAVLAWEKAHGSLWLDRVGCGDQGAIPTGPGLLEELSALSSPDWSGPSFAIPRPWHVDFYAAIAADVWDDVRIHLASALYPWDRDAHAAAMDEALARAHQALAARSAPLPSGRPRGQRDAHGWRSRLRDGVCLEPLLTRGNEFLISQAFRPAGHWRLVRIGLALLDWSLDHGGAWPDALAALPVTAAQLADPFLPGATVRYRCRADGQAWLWSVGPNGRDDIGASWNAAAGTRVRSGDDLLVSVGPLAPPVAGQAPP